MLMLGILYLILDGLTIGIDKTICSHLSLKCEFRVVLMMKIIIISFVWGNSAFGVSYVSFRRVRHLFKYNILLI